MGVRILSAGGGRDRYWIEYFNKRKTFYRSNLKTKKMSEEQEKLLKDSIAFRNSVSQQFFAFKDVTEKRLAQIESEANQVNKGINETLIEHQKWLEICDKSIKELRTQISVPTAKVYKLSPIPIKNWKFWK